MFKWVKLTFYHIQFSGFDKGRVSHPPLLSLHKRSWSSFRDHPLPVTAILRIIHLISVSTILPFPTITLHNCFHLTKCTESSLLLQEPIVCLSTESIQCDIYYSRFTHLLLKDVWVVSCFFGDRNRVAINKHFCLQDLYKQDFIPLRQITESGIYWVL